MTKDDYVQVMNATQFLVPMKQFREIQKMAVPLPSPVDDFDASIVELRKKEREMEEKMASTLARNTIIGAVDAHRKKKNNK